MSTILGVDPGNIETAYVVLEAATRKPLDFAKVPNEKFLEILTDMVMPAWDHFAMVDHVECEMLDSYGGAVGIEVFETIFWIGRFAQVAADYGSVPFERTTRRVIKRHHCHSTKVGDPEIKRAIVDRFVPGQPNFGKGTKAEPGFFYGFAKDIWAAYAVGVYRADVMEGYEP